MTHAEIVRAYSDELLLAILADRAAAIQWRERYQAVRAEAYNRELL